ncbi:probable xyloglucan galactosyltransferase GT17 [Arachis duranensis]|uniref:Probable xyloglucan galactosyltransferase GT17 n=1 Tax=Arachis duranensis TaxID=130453 RepID=A0A6P4CAG2_ARADU|nr:probable xyloglucan galactosyltransferase GT17 [Arachis duranensis]
MFFRKPSPTSSLNYYLPSSSDLFPKTKDKDPNIALTKLNKIKYLLFSFLLIATWLILLRLWLSPTTTTTLTTTTTTTLNNHNKTCVGSYPFYIYNLPPQFNLGLLEHCNNLNIYTNMCPHVANNGLGQPILTTVTALSSSSSSSWFATHQFIAEMIIHARLENHPCRTWDPSEARLFYVPFYGGLYASSVFREANLTQRDSLAVDLVDYLQSLPWFNINEGKDHFLALGRTAWDFMRTPSGPDFGANILLNLPPVKNMSVLTVERQPWQGKNQFGIPYPSYFHPKSLTELMTWQKQIGDSIRPYLFSFVGGTRHGLEKAKIRDEILKQCKNSMKCELVQCGNGASKCHDPMAVLEVMSKSRFCLQAPGDSFTRRSTFDSILAGCIPVFFSSHTAYTQYAWYLPDEKNTYSVFIDENDCGEGKKSIEEVLMGISKEDEEKMRVAVINLIHKVTYMHPNASVVEDVSFGDVVDIALERLSRIVEEKISGKDFGSEEV